ncbi:MAG: hypothetical protein ACE5EL_08095 [Anaerolineae bacterium]
MRADKTHRAVANYFARRGDTDAAAFLALFSPAVHVDGFWEFESAVDKLRSQ